MGAKRQARKELEKEQELAKLRAAEARKKSAKDAQRKAKDAQRKAAADRSARQAAELKERLAAMSPEERTSYDKRQAWLGGAVVLCVLLVMGGCIYSSVTDDESDNDSPAAVDTDPPRESSGDTEPSVDQDEQEFAAFDICTEFVKNRLKSPGSASFRNYFEDDGEVLVTGSGLGPYTVTSTVDAENSFGAETRIPFVCEVSNPDGDDRWVLDDLELVE